MKNKNFFDNKVMKNKNVFVDKVMKLISFSKKLNTFCFTVETPLPCERTKNIKNIKIFRPDL